MQSSRCVLGVSARATGGWMPESHGGHAESRRKRSFIGALPQLLILAQARIQTH